jgi:tetratricopeptide (TPR) repeat protein
MNERSVLRLRSCAVLLVVAGLSSGCGGSPEGLPDPAAIEAEPQVEQRILEATKDLRDDASSAALWGRLGEIYDLHRFAEQALTCYARASELDPQEWRWPYFAGLVLRETDQAASIAKLERGGGRSAADAPAGG